MLVKLYVLQEMGINADDESRWALDTIRFGPVHEVQEVNEEIIQGLLDEFTEMNPDYRFVKHDIMIIK